MATMPRVLLFDHTDTYIGDLDASMVVELVSKEEVNGEHCLQVTTLQELERTTRMLVRDGMGHWHEYVVLGAVAQHSVGGAILREYYAVWSIQYDLGATFIDTQVGLVPGHASIPHSANDGVAAALSGTGRWVAGTIDVTTQASGSFYRRSGWEGMQTVVEKWGGEIGATIEVDGTGVTARRVDLRAHIGEATPTRRFDYAWDVRGIKRTEPEEIWPCRIVPLGKSSETEAGGYTRRPSIASVNGGVMWLQDDQVAPLVRLPAGSGWDYPTAIVENDTYEEPADLKAWALDHITEYTRPRMTYEVDVAQLAQAGLNPHGVALGDEVVIVDRTFGPDGLRIQARVTKWEVNLLDPMDVKLTIGNARETLADQLQSIGQGLSDLHEQFVGMGEYQTSIGYLSDLLDRLNDEINATGGYTYITEGQGIRTYDVAVTDPLVGSEASKVVEIKGGTIRIADSRTSGGDWDWRTVFTSGHIAADLVTAAQLQAGYIGSATSGNYWNLDTGDLRIAGTSTIGNTTVTQLLSDVSATITGVDVEYAQNQSATTAPSSGWSTSAPSWRDGYYIWSRTKTTTPSGTSYSTPVMISGRDGEDGAPGSQGAQGVGVTAIVEQYYLSTSSTTQTGGSWSTTPAAYVSGRYYWTRSAVTWTDGTTTYTTPVLARGINSANSTAESASSAAAAAQQAVSDLSTQQAIFDLLTNGGTIQGLYMSGGQLYVNASYIQGGVLRAGGANNVNGIMQVLDASNNVVVDLSKDGAVLSHLANMRGQGSYVRSVLEVSEIETTSDRLWFVLTHASNGYTGSYHIPSVKISGTSADMSATYSNLYFVPKIFNNASFPEYYVSNVYSDAPIQVVGGIDLTSSDRNVPMFYAGPNVAATMYGSIPQVYTSLPTDQTAFYATKNMALICGGTVAIHGNPLSTYNAFELDSTNTLTIGHTGAHNVTTNHTGPVTITGTLTVSGTKSRVADTKDYGNRLLYCDETPAPTFTDFGSGTIGEDGLCYVELDPIFADTVNTSMAYQVFLQKCGRGDLWVSEKRPDYFVVEGDAGLAFDWQLKAHQSGYETLRLEDRDIERASVDDTAIEADRLEALYDTDYASEIEALYDTDLLGEAA